MKRIVILVLILVAKTSVRAQNINDSITNELTKLSRDSSLTGFGVAIVNKDSILYAKGFGYSDKENKTLYTINTTQPIASISKTFLGVALMKAKEMGKLNLNDNINDYLPFKIYNPNFPTEKITIKQLANHTSSIIDSDSYERSYVFENKIPWSYNKENETLKRKIKASVDLYNSNVMMSLGDFIKKQYVEDHIWYNKEQNFSKNHPGSAYKYSNMGANIAAYIIEQAAGQNYAEFVKEHILLPLKMNNTGWRGKNYVPKNTSTLYWYGYPIPYYDLVTYPDGNIMTNVVDYISFIRTVIQGYEGESNILTGDSYREMLKEPISPEFRKGIFWSVDSEKIGHSGSELGLLSHAYFLKDNGIAIIVFVNTSDTENGMIEVRDIYRTLLKYAKKQ